MLSKLPSGRWRAQIYDPRRGKNISVSHLLGAGFQSFATKREAKHAQARAEQKLAAIRGHGIREEEWPEVIDAWNAKHRATHVLHTLLSGVYPRESGMRRLACRWGHLAPERSPSDPEREWCSWCRHDIGVWEPGLKDWWTWLLGEFWGRR